MNYNPEYWRRRLPLLLIAVGLAVMMLGPVYRVCGDGFLRYRQLAYLLDEGRVIVGKYSICGPLFAVPLFYLDRMVDACGWLLSRYNFFLLAGGLVAFAVIFWKKVPAAVLTDFILLLLIGSLFTDADRFFYGETFTAICAGVGIALVAVRGKTWGWAAVALGGINAPAALAGMGMALLRRIWLDRRWRYGLYLLAAIVLAVLDMRWRCGGWLVSGYENDHGLKTPMPYSDLPGFGYPFFFGILSILFSFGKGLLFFCPGLILVWWRLKERNSPLRECYLLWLLYLVGLVLIYAKWWSWHGGWSYGPRFFLIASLPAVLALAEELAEAPRRRGTAGNLLIWLIMIMQIWSGVCGAVFSLDGMTVGYKDSYEVAVWYIPEFSPLWLPFRNPPSLRVRDWAVLVYALTVMLYFSWPFLFFFAGKVKALFLYVNGYLRTGWRW